MLGIASCLTLEPGYVTRGGQLSAFHSSASAKTHVYACAWDPPRKQRSRVGGPQWGYVNIIHSINALPLNHTKACT